jgi:RND family efflux transporter MFP subunit
MTENKKDLLKQLSIDRNVAPERRVPWGWIVLAVAVLAGAWVLLSMFKSRGDVVLVKTAIARPASAPANASVLDASGYVVARRQATVSSKVTGKVESVLIEEGMMVQKDQLLATLEPIDSMKQFDLTLAQARAAEAQLGDLQVQLADARVQLTRQKDLKAKGLTPQATLDAAQTQVNSIAARLVTASRNVDVSKSSVAVSKQNLDNTKVYAPFAGVVIARSAQVGEIVSPLSAGGGFTRTGIGTIVDMESLEVEVDVNEAYLEKVRAKAPVEITLNAYQNWKIPGSVIAIIPTADRSKATVKVRIAFGEKDQRVLPDMGARVAFLPELAAVAEQPMRTGVLIPSNALIDGKQAYLLQNGQLKKVSVTIVETVGSDVRIEAGIAAGDSVVIEPKVDYADGLKVKVQ